MCKEGGGGRISTNAKKYSTIVFCFFNSLIEIDSEMYFILYMYVHIQANKLLIS